MIKIAIYGKGGIGKSTVCCNAAELLSARGLRVMQIGCDPKADSTAMHFQGERIPTVLGCEREKGGAVTLDDIVRVSKTGVICAEAGGPLPGTGCAGRGILNALELLGRLGAYEQYRPDLVLYDVLGDVVCGGFAGPMRKGCADSVFVVTSGENMSRYAAANIMTAVTQFRSRGYAQLGGILLNRRGVPDEDAQTEALAAEFGTHITAALDRCAEYAEAEQRRMTVASAFPQSAAAAQLRTLAERLLEDAGGRLP